MKRFIVFEFYAYETPDFEGKKSFGTKEEAIAFCEANPRTEESNMHWAIMDAETLEEVWRTK